MLKKAEQKIGSSKELKLKPCRYGAEQPDWEPFDLVVLSYSLTMIGEDRKKILRQIHEDLTPNGYIAVVDFHDTSFNWFRRWMYRNHVVMDGTFFPLLKKHFAVEKASVQKAYLGLWRYFTFLGKRA